MRYSLIDKDRVDLEKFSLFGMKRRVQNDGSNCGVYSLKVAIYSYIHMYTIRYNYCHCIANYYVLVHNFISMQMAEQLLDTGGITETMLCRMNMEEARRDIACSLLSYSGICK